MKAKEFIKKIEDLNPNDDTDIEILLIDFNSGLFDFLEIEDVVRNIDCSGINAIGVNAKLSHRLN